MPSESVPDTELIRSLNHSLVKLLNAKHPYAMELVAMLDDILSKKDSETSPERFTQNLTLFESIVSHHSSTPTQPGDEVGQEGAAGNRIVLKMSYYMSPDVYGEVLTVMERTDTIDAVKCFASERFAVEFDNLRVSVREKVIFRDKALDDIFPDKSTLLHEISVFNDALNDVPYRKLPEKPSETTQNTQVKLYLPIRSLNIAEFSPVLSPSPHLGEGVDYGKLLRNIEKKLFEMRQLKNPTASSLMVLSNKLQEDYEKFECHPEDFEFPEEFLTDVETLSLVVNAQYAREIIPEEQIDRLLNVHMLFTEDLVEKEIQIEIDPLTTLYDFKNLLCRELKLTVSADKVLIEYRNDIVPEKKDSSCLRDIFSQDFGDVFIAVRLPKTEKNMFADMIFEKKDSLRIEVFVPSGRTINEFMLEEVDLSMDFGSVREVILEETGFDDVILKHKGYFIFPHSDGEKVGSTLGIQSLKGLVVRKITAYSRKEAVRHGQIKEYKEQLVNFQRAVVEEPENKPVGGVSTALLLGNNPEKVLASGESFTVKLRGEDERLAVFKFIEEQRRIREQKLTAGSTDTSTEKETVAGGVLSPALPKTSQSTPVAIPVTETPPKPVSRDVSSPANSIPPPPPIAQVLGPQFAPKIGGIPPPPPIAQVLGPQFAPKTGIPPPPPMGGIPPPPPMGGIPPPPPMGGIPPPPPMGLGGPPRPPGLNLNLNVPKSKCRIFHWKTLRSNGGIWSDVVPLLREGVNKEMLDVYFAKKKKLKVTRVRKASDSEQLEGNSILQLPDARSSQNMEIMLKKLPKLDRLEYGINNLDQTILTQDAIELMFQNLPKASDVKFVSTLAVSGTVLTEANSDASVRYVALLSKIPRWEERLKTWNATFEIVEKQKFVKIGIQKLLCAVKELKSLESLRYVFAVILQSGNHMNQGSSRGNAMGFQLDSLLKLSSTKTTIPMKKTSASQGGASGSLLDYVVEQVKTLFPEALNLNNEIEAIATEMGRASVKIVYESLTQLEQTVDKYRKVCQTISKDAGSGAFEKILAIYENAFTENQRLSGEFQRLIAEIKGLFGYLGYSVKDIHALMNEVYPATGKDGDKKAKVLMASKSTWNPSDSAGLKSSIDALAEARAKKQTNRDVLVREAIKAVNQWKTKLDLEIEVVKLLKSSNTNDEATTEISEISASLKNLFKLLLDFCKQYSNSVHACMRGKIKFGEEKEEIDEGKLYGNPCENLVFTIRLNTLLDKAETLRASSRISPVASPHSPIEF